VASGSNDRQKPLTVLITNIAFSFRSGTEIVVDQIARGLNQRGHRPIVFSTYNKGAMADTLRRQGIAVVDRLAQVGAEPDIIHGQHNVTTVMAMMAFPQCPVIFSCHDFDAPKDRALLVTRVRRYIAVDEICRERLLTDGVQAGQIVTLYNAVDLEQYPRRDPLPPRPRTVLVLTKGADHLAVARSASERAGLTFEALGSGVDAIVDDLPQRLRRYDIVIATARTAKEAIAAGCAVIVGDHRGFAGLVTRDVVAEWRRHNFGRKILTTPMTEDNLLGAIAGYDAADAAAVTDFIRAEDGLDAHIDKLERLYREVIEQGPRVDVAGDMKALSVFLEDFLISRDFTRPWTELYRNVVQEEIGVFDRALDGSLERHGSKTQVAITARLDQLERTLRDHAQSQASDVRELGASLRLTVQLRLLARAVGSRLRRLFGTAR